MKKPIHLHILVRLRVKNPEALGKEELKKWIVETIAEQNLSPVTKPQAAYVEDEGNKGFTGGVNLKTSHFAFHIWDETGEMQADLYTCGPLDVAKFLARFSPFLPTEVEYLVLDRENGFQILHLNKITLK